MVTANLANSLQQPGRPSASANSLRLIKAQNDRPVHLVLNKDFIRTIKRGHPWVYSDALRELPPASAGSIAVLKDKAGEIIAKGYYDPGSKIALRICALQKERLDEQLVRARLERAALLRKSLFDPADTNGFRLINGEGDGLPGLVCDVYNTAAVLKLDGDGAAGFYDVAGIAAWLMQNFKLSTVFLKYKSGEDSRGRLVAGEQPRKPVAFQEHGVTFQADIVQGQKTGFFLDQRDNRQRVGRLARGKRVLNVFGYTGGFSVYAGVGGASHVTTVDIARPALEFAKANWELNDLPKSKHETDANDAFQFLELAVNTKERWDLVIVDPPSFAPNKQSVDKAKASYERVFALAAQVTAPNGLLALASCSSHIPYPMFMEVCGAALGKARRLGYVLGAYGQPEDHPYPTACEELRYLKFVMHRLEG